MADVQKKPNPGSEEARAAGCICPRMDNNNGRYAPWPPNGWWTRDDCPMHGGWNSEPSPTRNPAGPFEWSGQGDADA